MPSGGSKVIKEPKKYHFNRLIENSDNKMKTIWDIAKLLTGKRKILTTFTR